MEHLVFQLHAPLASWGEPAVGEDRPTAERPTRSALVGLLAGALGLRRDQEKDQRDLRDGYGVSVRVDRAGLLLRDYHTAQVPSRSDKRGHTRKDEVNLPSERLNTILSTRDYRADILAMVAVWRRDPPGPWPLDELAAALREPVFRPYLGRISCPPALPFAPQVVDASDLVEAFARYTSPDPWRAGHHASDGPSDVYWDTDHPNAGLEAIHHVSRRDEPGSRTLWRFGQRTELQGRHRFEGGS